MIQGYVTWSVGALDRRIFVSELANLVFMLALMAMTLPIVLRASVFTRVSAAILLGACMLVFDQLLDLAEEIPAWNWLPILGGPSILHEPLEHTCRTLGLGFFILGFYGLLAEARVARRQLDRDREELGREVAERNQIAAELREGAERYRLIFEGIEDGVALIGANLRPILFNQRIADMLGYSREELEVIDPLILLHPEDRARVLGNNRRRLAGETVERTYELRFITKSGEVMYVEGTFDLIRKDDQVIGVQSIYRDITERKRTEEALRNIAQGVSFGAGTAFFDQLVFQLAKALNVDHAFIGLLRGFDGPTPEIETLAMSSYGKPAGKCVYTLAGTPCEHVVAKEICCFPTGVQALFPEDHLLAQLGIDSYVGAPLFDSAGAPLGLMSVMHYKALQNAETVISMVQIFAARAAAELERKRAEDGLTQERDLLQTILESSTDHIFLKDASGRFLRTNRAHAQYLGVEHPSLVIGKTDRDFYFEPDAVEARQNEADILTTGRPLMDKVKWIAPRQSGHRWLSTSKVPLYDAQGKAVGILGITRDITERRNADEERDRLRAQVLNAQKLESLGVLAGGIAHDFNNLLMGVLGHASLALLE
ncbi:MAG: PAS domain S-box protein, partial [Candidatus Hydrogenedentes bacterium]|nr:PAS domain S-box protein [Candidatus Hydrogenedentota bacterium]